MCTSVRQGAVASCCEHGLDGGVVVLQVGKQPRPVAVGPHRRPPLRSRRQRAPVAYARPSLCAGSVVVELRPGEQELFVGRRQLVQRRQRGLPAGGQHGVAGGQRAGFGVGQALRIDALPLAEARQGPHRRRQEEAVADQRAAQPAPARRQQRRGCVVGEQQIGLDRRRAGSASPAPGPAAARRPGSRRGTAVRHTRPTAAGAW